MNSKFSLLGQNLKKWPSKSRKIVKFSPYKNLRAQSSHAEICQFFDFLKAIFSGFDRVRKILSSQKNQISRDLCTCELKIFLTRSKPNLNRESRILETLIFDSIK